MALSLDNYLMGSTDKIAFLELKEELLEKFGEVPQDFTIPVFVEDIKEYAKGAEHFSTQQITTAMLYLLGLDPAFKHRAQYLDFLYQAVENPEFLAMSLAIEKLEVNAYKDALIYMRSARGIDPKHKDICFDHALLCAEFSEEISDKDLKEELLLLSQEGFKKVLEIDPKEYTASFQLGLIFLNRGDYQNALPRLRTAFEEGEGELKERAHFLIEEIHAFDGLVEAEALIDQERYEDALEKLSLIRMDEINLELKYQILFAKGFCNKALGKMEQATLEYSAALEINDQSTLLLAELGVCYAYLSEYERSLEFYLAAIELDSTSVGLLNNVAMVYLALHDIQKAKEYISQAKEIAPNDEIVEATIRRIRETEEGKIDG
ncbi:MAG: hypothetical protein Q4A75_05245 [Peptostreptococcaceae bacterium]|nr:hypothetical protein [Peptostreptococcaceae bacterium]